MYRYVTNRPTNNNDPYGLTWMETLCFLDEFLIGFGPTHRFFGPNSNQALDMMDAPGVNEARNQFYNKNSLNLRFGGQLEEHNTWVDYGLEGLFQAGFDPTEQSMVINKNLCK